ncbi:unnamed protein product [Medioppia subpectinata]|uniref:VWFA domain-containing protein n=1 Tax=Medioppia subpectinata TaxID=1979941 RepID=A0A7R9KHM5_9ACAR|nr:unnamed protein product [Medioppia subpectinata]CAG2103760.1 unnamed protein product [Medioppia subpectinata]
MSERIVFVLDVSRSMKGIPIKTLHSETVRCINRIHDGNYVGIVLFGKTAWTANELTKLTSQSVRQSIVTAVPDNYQGSWYEGTDIRAGVMEGLVALSRAKIDTNGAKIFLVTDGHHDVGNKDYVGDVLPHLIKAQVHVYCLAIGEKADPNLEKLSTETGSQVFSSSRVDAESREIIGRVMEAAMKEVITSKEMAEVVTHTVVNEVVVINGNTYETRVPIEADIGRNTQIHVRSEVIKDIDVDINGPSGAVYSTTGGGQIAKRLDLQECRLYLELTESGLWTIKLTKQSSSTIRAHLVVESNPIGANAIELRVFLRVPEINCPPIIICRLCKGNDPIVGAIVTATVDRPGGTQTDFPLNLYHNSGYYYAYFTDYSGAGRYNVSALAVNDVTTTYRGTPTGAFQRQRVANCFYVRADSMPTQPPPDGHFNQLLLSNQFGYHQNTPVVTAAPGPVRQPQPTPERKSIPLLSDQMKALKARLSANYIRTKRAVDGLQVPVGGKTDLINKFAAFEHFFSSIRETSAEEIDGYQRRLDEINEQVTLRK